MLAGDDEATDGDSPWPPVCQRAQCQRPHPLEGGTVQLHDLPTGIEREDGVGITQPLQLGRLRQ